MRRMKMSKLMLIGLCAMGLSLGCDIEDPGGGGEGGAGGTVGAGGEGGAGEGGAGAAGGAGGEGGAGAAGGEGGAGAAGGAGGAGAAGGEGGAGAAGGEGGAGAAGGAGGAGAAGGEGGAGAAGGEGGGAGGEGGEGGGGGDDCREVPSVDAEDPLYDRYEGTGFDNACRVDADCFRGGCNSEICTASNEVAGTCDVVPIPAGDCGCVQGECIWHVEECGCVDSDDDGTCDAEDNECNADGTPLMCRRAAPECRRGTVPEVRDGCYTDRCVTWEQCGDVEPPCPDADDDGTCDADDSACNADGTLLMCRRAAPECRRGTVPEVRDGCYTDRCVTWEQCGDVEPPCPDADGDGICDDEDRVCGPNEVLCDAPPPRCREGQVPEAEGGCWTGRCVSWEQCGEAEPEPQACGGIAGIRCRDEGQVCVDDPRDNCDPERGGADCGGICVDEDRLCTPVRDGEFGLCEAIIGFAMNADGICAAVSGCGCDANCAGRVFPTQRACQAQCAGPMCREDADDDAICDGDDSVCNADGTPLQCRRPAPDCPRGTVPEVRETCYTDRCVTWEQCGEEPCPDADGDGRCDADDVDCNADGTPLMCRRAPPVCRERGTVPEIRNGCYTDRCVTWEECGEPAVEACAPIQPGEFGLCRAIIGWGIDARSGECAIVSGCGCDERCEGRVFENEAACERACEENVEPPAAPEDLGDDCRVDSDCDGNVCWDFSDYDQFCGGRACSLRCEADADCHAAFRAAGADRPEGSSCGDDGKCTVLGTGFGAFFCQ